MSRTALLLFVLGATACIDYGARSIDENLGETEHTDTDWVDTSVDTADTADTGETGDTSPPQPEAGCADGEREGFLSWNDYPDIAACSGSWEVPGITRPNLAPTCSNGAGDDSSNPDGRGCSAADVCAAGWHVCDGAVEVEDKAGTCADAVPPGTPDKHLLFAVVQHSDDGSMCNDGTANGNDVFGCGNLGTTLDASKNCGVLTKVLASMQPGTCGFNEAEPNLGPWECAGDSSSHLAEGTLVTKKGCPGGSCSYDGNAVGSSDKGGVICCMN